MGRLLWCCVVLGCNGFALGCNEPAAGTAARSSLTTASPPAATATVASSSGLSVDAAAAAASQPRPRQRGGVPLPSAPCDAGNVQACDEACKQAAGPDCYWLARRYAQGDQVTKDLAVALRLYTRSCDGGVARGCYHAGRLHEDRQQPTQAAEMLRRACKGGDYLGCKYAQAYDEPMK